MEGFELGVTMSPKRGVEVVAVNDDWYEVWVHGTLVSEGHSVDEGTLINVVNALGLSCTTRDEFRNIYTDEPVASLEEAYHMPEDEE